LIRLALGGVAASWEKRSLPAQNYDKAIHDQQKHDHEDQEEGRAIRHRMIQGCPQSADSQGIQGVIHGRST
jgi:hypothetical protein